VKPVRESCDTRPNNALKDASILVQKETIVAGVGERRVREIVVLLLLVCDLFTTLSAVKMAAQNRQESLQQDRP
jgi:hypothetical protein